MYLFKLSNAINLLNFKMLGFVSKQKEKSMVQDMLQEVFFLKKKNLYGVCGNFC